MQPEIFRLDADISIHALREEGDVQCVINCVQLFEFLSTPSARRATQCVINCVQLFEFLSTPSARRANICSLGYDQLVQIFLSTPSARRATSED